MGSDHFYTVNTAEVSSAIRQDGYHLEGIACFVYDPNLNQPGTTPLFRLFNPNSGDHFYTTNPAEVNFAIGVGYRSEGIACDVFSSSQPGTTSLFRLFNPNSGDHFYTTDKAEDQSAVANDGYQDEGIACHVYGLANAPGGTTPLYRLYNGM